MARKKEKIDTSVVLFDVFYEDGCAPPIARCRASISPAPAATTPAKTFIMGSGPQDRRALRQGHARDQAGRALRTLVSGCPMSDVRDNRASHRFELEIDDHVAKAWYRKQGNVVTFTHTDVPDALSGKGVGTRLAKGALDAVRAAGRKSSRPARSSPPYIGKHREYADLLAEPSKDDDDAYSPMRCSTTSRRCGARRCSNR